MALRLVNKINRQFVKNVCRSLSGKRDQLPEIEKPKEEAAPTVEQLPHAEHYHVCRPRTTPLKRYAYEAQNEADMAKRNVAMQHLQPALLPEYYKPPLEINACMYPDPVTESEKQSFGQARRFEESKTCKNVTLPLKVPKLASPFPDPVKVMQSHTVSDQEKAEQMMAESRMMRSIPEKQVQVRTMPPTRSYSTKDSGGKGKDGEKRCKLPGVKEQKQCVSMISPNCVPPKSISCVHKKQKQPPCVKKEAPYPSYSETCHEDPLERPSECKMCPWKPEEHPSFKPPKNKFHTSSFLAAKKEECTNPNTRKKKPCGWVQEDKKKQESMKPSTAHRRTTKPKTKTTASLMNLEEGDGNAMFVATKPPCKKPVDPKCKNEPKKKDNKNKPSPDNKGTKKTTAGLGFAMDSWLQNLAPKEPGVNQSASLQSGDNVVIVSGAVLQTATKKPGCGKDGKGKCKKFPFQKCSLPFPRKPPKERVDPSKCPKKKRPRLVQDCPGEKEDNCKRSAGLTTAMGPGQNLASEINGYYMKGDSIKKDNKKCPRINIDQCKPEDESDDPCKRKRKGKTLICPKDLLNKKRRNPKKKTCPILPPLMPPTRPSRSATNL